MNARRLEIIQQAALQLGAGGTAGILEVLMMHPFDLIKTRMQLQSTILPIKNPQKHYKNALDCIVKMCKHEGFMSFYKGVVPPILAETPKKAATFLTFDQYQRVYPDTSPNPMTYALAGGCAGVTEAALINPFEVVKVTMQADTNKAQFGDTWRTTKELIRQGGFGVDGLNKGITGTMARNGVFNMIFFGVYHSVLTFLPELEETNLDFFAKFTIGFMAGTIASCINVPFDVAKSRMQGPQPNPCQVKYRWLVPTMKTIYREEGLKALYKGIVPKLLRLAPGGVILIVVYDFMHKVILCNYIV